MMDASTYERKRKFAGNVFTSPVSCFSSKLSTKDNLKLRWVERISSSHLPSANFIFEVTFPEVDAMRFEAVARSIFYSEDSDDFMECYIVKDVMPFFANVIYPGDILLRVNGQSLLRKSVNGEFIDPQKSSSCFENIASAAQTSANATPSFGVTIRFMRTGSTSLNFTPSPAELNLFQVDKHIAAKFLVVKVVPPPAPITVNAADGTVAPPAPAGAPQWSIQLSYLDQQLPTSISQMMLGGSVTWDHSLLLNRSDCAANAQCTQGAILLSTTGTHSGNSGPGAFFGLGGSAASLHDSWIVPGGSIYSHATTSVGGEGSAVGGGGGSGSGSGAGGSGGGVIGDGTVVDLSPANVNTGGVNGSADIVATAVAALIAAATGTTTTPTSTTTTNTTTTTTTPQIDTLTSVSGITGVRGSVHQLDSTTLSATGQSVYGSTGAALTVGVPLSARQGAAIGNGGWVAILLLTVRADSGSSGGSGGVSVSTSSGSGVSGGTSAEYTEQHLSLGRFDKESDAKLALQQALLEVQETGSFRPRYYMKRLSAALLAANPIPTPVLPKPLLPLQQNMGMKGPLGTYSVLNNNNNTQSKYLANLQSQRNASTGALNNTLLNSVVSVGETKTNDFSAVAKVVLALAPGPGMHGIHGSNSSGNISSLAYQKK